MDNKKFNIAITKLFNSTTSNSKLVDLVTDFWINNNVNDKQTEILERLKHDADSEYCPSIEPYLIKEQESAAYTERKAKTKKAFKINCLLENLRNSSN